MYDSGCQLLEELLEVKGSSVSSIMDFVKKSEDELVFGIETKSTCSHEDVSDIGSSLSGISIEGEEGMKLSDVFRWEDGVFGGYILGKDGFEFFLLDFSFGHDRYF